MRSTSIASPRRLPRSSAIRVAIASAVVLFAAGCGGGNEKTLRELGSSKADTTRLTSSTGDVRAVDADSAARPGSDLRIRVRDRDALDPSQVRKATKAKKPKTK
jgi:hypothetical protein